MNKYKSILLSIIIIAALTSPAIAKPTGYIGSTPCEACHKEIYDTWKGSKHASGVYNLKQKNTETCNACQYNFSEYCGRSAQQIYNVGCEACHGPVMSMLKTMGILQK
jgi:hypothetical protein